MIPMQPDFTLFMVPPAPINFSPSRATPPPTSCHNPIPPSIFHSVVIYFQKSCQNAPCPSSEVTLLLVLIMSSLYSSYLCSCLLFSAGQQTP